MEKMKKIKGIGASRGKVIGEAIIAFSPEEAYKKIKKVKTPILVTVTTTPDWTPLFFKVKGVITEMGNILCHAAIVAREVGIPCVTGAVNATGIIRDFDEVEIDGEKGIVIVRKSGNK